MEGRIAEIVQRKEKRKDNEIKDIKMEWYDIEEIEKKEKRKTHR